MKKDDVRIIKKNNPVNTDTYETDKVEIIFDDATEPVNTPRPSNNVTEPVVIPRPCDDEPQPPEPIEPTPNPDWAPDIPPRPTPNPERPTPPSPYGRLEFVDGLQRIGKNVSIKVDEDSERYVKTSSKGLSVKYLVDRLNNVRKALGNLSRTTTVLRSDLNQLSNEINTPAFTEKLERLFVEFHEENGRLLLNLGNGIYMDKDGNLSAYVDSITTDIDEDGKIASVWTSFERE